VSAEERTRAFLKRQGFEFQAPVIATNEPDFNPTSAMLRRPAPGIFVPEDVSPREKRERQEGKIWQDEKDNLAATGCLSKREQEEKAAILAKLKPDPNTSEEEVYARYLAGAVTEEEVARLRKLHTKHDPRKDR